MLDREHFEEVCAMTTHFKNYLKRVHKEDEQERAIRAKTRTKNRVGILLSQAAIRIGSPHYVIGLIYVIKSHDPHS